jgi:hypothetical protein
MIAPATPQSVNALAPPAMTCGRVFSDRSLQLFANHLWRASEKAVWTWIGVGPKDLVLPEVVNKHRRTGFHRLERSPTSPLEDLARTHGQMATVESLAGEVPIDTFRYDIG